MAKLPEFEELAKLSPDELEKVRQECVEEIIESARDEDQKRRLRGLQFTIDMERRKAKTPMAACIKLSAMMHESFLQLKDALNKVQDTKKPNLQSLSNNREENSTKNIVSETKILKFKRDKNDQEL